MGHRVTEETKRKISISIKGEKHPFYGKHLTDEHKKKLSDAHKGKPVWNKGLPLRADLKEKLRLCNIGRHHTKDTKEKIRSANLGQRRSESVKWKWQKENNPNWQGGISYEPYCPKFNNEFKERVRAFFGYRCIECGSMQTNVKLDVHHVLYNKKVCCNNEIPLFVPLCKSCHRVTIRNREYWSQHFREMIMSYYCGKCYFSVDEMKSFEGVS